MQRQATHASNRGTGRREFLAAGLAAAAAAGRAYRRTRTIALGRRRAAARICPVRSRFSWGAGMASSAASTA